MSDLLVMAACIFGGCLALFIAFWVLLLAWPLLLCWYLGHLAIGVLAEVIWLACMR